MSIKFEKNIRLNFTSESKGKYLQPEIYDCALMNLESWSSRRSFGRFWHIYFNSRAGASVLFNNCKYSFNSKHVYLIPAHTLFAASLENPVIHFYIDFTIGGFFSNLKYGIYEFPAECVKSLLPKFISSESQEMREAIAFSIIWHYLVLLPEEAFVSPDRKKFDPRIRRAIEIMESNIGVVNDISTICRRIGMTPNSFYLLFKRETNKNPRTFLMELRIGRANFLLANTNETIDEIAEATGFANRYHFSKYYKKHTGKTPVKNRLENNFFPASEPAEDTSTEAKVSELKAPELKASKDE